MRHGLEYLTKRVFIDDEHGFARLTTRSGEVMDATPDLYDHAFILFGFSWAYRATGDAAIIPWMHKTVDCIERILTHPGGKGFWHDATKEGWRQQNPHMHLLEASLSAIEATGEDRFVAMASHVANLFRDHFFNRDHQLLLEFFTDDWRPAPGDDGKLVEPGHQFEWAWILANCKRLIGVDMDDEARALVRFAEVAGVDPQSGATYNSVDCKGAPIDRGSRTWPNTERIKAAVAMYELDGVDPMPVFEQSAGLLLRRYLNTEPYGLWVDRFDGEGRPQAENVPASTLYHVFLAFTEMRRIRSMLKKNR